MTSRCKKKEPAARPNARTRKPPLPPPGRWEAWVPEWTPTSVNVIVGQVHHGTRCKKKDREYISLFTGHIRPADRQRMLHVVYSYPKGRIGIDLSNGLKSIEDALVKLDVLRNDSRKWLNWISATSVEGPLGTKLIVADRGWAGPFFEMDW